MTLYTGDTTPQTLVGSLMGADRYFCDAHTVLPNRLLTRDLFAVFTSISVSSAHSTHMFVCRSYLAPVLTELCYYLGEAVFYRGYPITRGRVHRSQFFWNHTVYITTASKFCMVIKVDGRPRRLCDILLKVRRI